MSEHAERFDQWAIVELFGHQRIAGRVTEQAIGGQTFVRVDVPEQERPQIGTLPAYTRLFGPGAIYCINPVDEATARAAVGQCFAEPVSAFQAGKLLAGARGDDDDDDDEWDGDDG